MPSQIVPLQTKPGIQRDGTMSHEFYTDGEWVRFQRGLPKKMAGYRSIHKFPSEICRGMHTFGYNTESIFHLGGAGKVERFLVDINGNGSFISARTPAGFSSNSNNMWTFDVMYDSSSTANSLIAHVSPNLSNITNNVGGAIYSEDITGTGALVNIALAAGGNASGGIVVLHPYLMYFGNGGVIGWSVAGEPTDLSGIGSGLARVTGSKLIRGLPLRSGGGTSPSGLFWSDDSVIRASFSGGATIFAFDTIATGTSILSTNSVIDMDGVFFWAGVDRFLMFNGVVREVPNTQNINFFFDNLDWDSRQKVFCFKVPRYGEIWWCFPTRGNTECNHAIILNTRENCWYDTPLPSAGRTAGTFSNFFGQTVMTDATINSDSGYKLWLHEESLDLIDGMERKAIKSYFTTSIMAVTESGVNKKIHLEAIEPDFTQVGDLKVKALGKANSRSKVVESNEVIFPDNAENDPTAQIVSFKYQSRELRLKFESDILGGNYEMGNTMIHINNADGTTIR